MLEAVLSFFQLPSIFKPPLKGDKFSFSKDSVFKHACATPLTILMSNLESKISDERHRSSSLEAVNKLTQIIRSVTEDRIISEEFEVCGAINEVLCLLRGKLDEGCISSRVLADKSLLIVGNKLYFQESLICVLNNSIEAYGKINKKPINIILRRIGNSIRIDITDYASGMNSLMQRLVLLNGVTTKSKGTGLGLYFAKQTIEKLFLGKMSINSAINFGTHVAWTIPLAKPCNQNL